MEDSAMTKALVTGGSGFIGSALVKGLVERGYEVTVFDNNYRGTRDNLADIFDKISFFEGDIRDKEEVRASVAGQDMVFHLAFINGTENFYNHPDLVLDVGIRGHLNILDLVKEYGIETFVYASSSEIYQTPSIIPTPEDVPGLVPDVTNPRYSYGGSKLLGEIMTLHYLREEDATRRIIFRPHNIYGPAMGFEHVLPQIIKKIFDATEGLTRNSATIEIQGSGTETRAFCYIDDAVDGIILSAEKGGDKDIYHVGKEEEISIIDFIRTIAMAMEVNLELTHGALQEGGTPRRCPDISKLRGIGYDPRVTLEDGIRKSVEWYVSYFRAQLAAQG